MGLVLGGHREEDRFWQDTLRTLAARFGVDAEPETSVVCVDKAAPVGTGGERSSFERVPLGGPHRDGAAQEAPIASRHA